MLILTFARYVWPLYRILVDLVYFHRQVDIYVAIYGAVYLESDLGHAEIVFKVCYGQLLGLKLIEGDKALLHLVLFNRYNRCQDANGAG